MHRNSIMKQSEGHSNSEFAATSAKKPLFTSAVLSSTLSSSVSPWQVAPARFKSFASSRDRTTLKFPTKSRGKKHYPPGSHMALAYSDLPATIDVSMIEWPTPPPRSRRDYNTRRSDGPLATQSAGVYSANTVQDYTADGLSVMQLLLTEWHKSLAKNKRYYRSFTVYGQVKMQEARNATSLLGTGPNNTITCAAWELLSELFSSRDVPAGPAILTLLSHLVWPLFSNVSAVLSNLAAKVHSQVASTSRNLSSSFDIGAVTHQEMHTRLMAKIEKLTVESKALDCQRLLSSKEHAKRQLMFQGEVTIWQRSIRQLVFASWQKWARTNKVAIRKLIKVLFSDRQSTSANNKRFVWKLVFCTWRSETCRCLIARINPEISSSSDRSVALERLVTRDEKGLSKLQAALKSLQRDLNLSKNTIMAKQRQLDMYLRKLERLRASMEPKRVTMECFSKYSRLCWNMYADTIASLLCWANSDLQAAPADWSKKKLGKGLGWVSRGQERTIFTTSKDFASFTAKALLGESAWSKPADPIIKSPIYDFVIKKWAVSNESDDEAEMTTGQSTEKNVDLPKFQSRNISKSEALFNEEKGDEQPNEKNPTPKLHNAFLRGKMKSIMAFFGVRQDARAHAKFELKLASMTASDRRKLRREQRQRLRDMKSRSGIDELHISDRSFLQQDEDDLTGGDFENAVHSSEVAKARLLHHFAENPGFEMALPSDQMDALQDVLTEQRGRFEAIAKRSADVATFKGGDYQPMETEREPFSDDSERKATNYTRSRLANAALTRWKQLDCYNFLSVDKESGQLGSLRQAIHTGTQCRAMRLGASVQGWHTMARHVHDMRVAKKTRDDQMKRDLQKSNNVLAMAVAMYGKFDRKRLMTVVENDMIARRSKARRDTDLEDEQSTIDNTIESNSKKNTFAGTNAISADGADVNSEKIKGRVDQLLLQREVDDLEALCLDFAPEIRGWYIRYSGVNGMGTHDFYLFVKQIRVLSRQFRLVDIDLVRVASGAGDQDEMLNPAEFVEALIRLSIRRYASAQIASPVSSGTQQDKSSQFTDLVSDKVVKSRRVVDRVRRLLVENVCAHAQLVDIDSFRMRFADPGVQRSLNARRRWLVGKFREYCAADASQAAVSDQAMYTMSLSEWEKFLRDHHVFDARFRNRSAATLFVCAQAPNFMDEENVTLESALEDNQELIYQEFLEALVALAHFRTPDPFMPLGDRVSKMLTQLDNVKPLDRYFASSRFMKEPAHSSMTMTATSTGKILRNLGRIREQ